MTRLRHLQGLESASIHEDSKPSNVAAWIAPFNDQTFAVIPLTGQKLHPGQTATVCTLEYLIPEEFLYLHAALTHCGIFPSATFQKYYGHNSTKYTSNHQE